MGAFVFKYDLAREYFPGVTAKVASRLLRREMQRNAGLMTELERADYKPSQKRLTPRQVEDYIRLSGGAVEEGAAIQSPRNGRRDGAEGGKGAGGQG